jgi:hypothetical protein
MSACDKEPDLKINELEQKQASNDGIIKLGKKLKNPYSVANMKEAYKNLVNKGVLKSAINIEATHIYLRFLPESESELENFENSLMAFVGNEDDLEEMESSFSVEFYDYPLDYELEDGGTYYYDPELPPDGITWQYTVVPANFPIPQTGNYQKLDELYIQYETDLIEPLANNSSEGSQARDLWLTLENEALKIAGDPDAGNMLKSSWRPSGKIMVYDDVKNGYIPIQNAKVRVRRWFTTYRGYTDVNGNFSVNGTFLRPANYSIKWESDYWDIREGLVYQACYNGPKIQTAWNLNIGSSTDTNKSMRMAHIHRALYRYFYDDVLDLKRPIHYFPDFKVKVAYRHMSGKSTYWSDVDGSGITPNINIYGIDHTGNTSKVHLYLAPPYMSWHIMPIV